jgi:hypothetical protein
MPEGEWTKTLEDGRKVKFIYKELPENGIFVTAQLAGYCAVAPRLETVQFGTVQLGTLTLCVRRRVTQRVALEGPDTYSPPPSGVSGVICIISTCYQYVGGSLFPSTAGLGWRSPCSFLQSDCV